MGIGIDAFEANGFPPLLLKTRSSRREEALINFGFDRSLWPRAIPHYRIAVFIRVNLVEVNFRLRHGGGPGRILFRPGWFVVHFRDRFAVVKPILFIGPSILRKASVGAREALDDVHHSFSR